MSKHDYIIVPNPLPDLPRRDEASFRDDATKPGEKRLLVWKNDLYMCIACLACSIMCPRCFDYDAPV